jgi:hypothetical protein
MEKKFVGEWKYLGKAIFDMAEKKANRAIRVSGRPTGGR